MDLAALTEQALSEWLAARPPRALDAPELKSSAVLVPIFWREGAPHLVFTRRTEDVATHKSQICFPGGRVAKGDRGPVDTALRESEEEIALARRDVRVLGILDDLQTLSIFRITPVVGAIADHYPFRSDPREVAEIFDLPLAFFLDPDRLTVRHLAYPDGRDRPVYFYDAGPERTIWGATARIVKSWLDALSLG